ncbi:MAG: transposase [Tannerella sp.]|jgi:transposase-like protein|nr:transposase [Tannerella sp.]
MVKRERKFYSEKFKERVLASYYNTNESVSMVARRFDVSRDTVSSWVYRKRTVSESKKRVKLVSP